MASRSQPSLPSSQKLYGYQRDISSTVVSLDDLNGLLEILVAIAGKWELFLIALGVSEGDIDQIKTERAQLPESSKLSLLDGLKRWVKSSVCPTYGRIIEALNTELITDKPLAAKVDEFAQQVSQDKDMSSALAEVGSPSQPADGPVHHERYDKAQAGAKREELRECFTSHAVRLKDLLKAKYTDEKLPDFLKVFILKLPSTVKDENEKFFHDKSLEISRCKTFDELFVHLDIYWDYLNYTLLEGIIEAHGTEKMRQEMESYVKDLQEFRRKTKLFIYWQVEHHKKGRVPPPGFRQFVTKHCITGESTLEDIEKIRLAIAQEFHLSKFALRLIDVVDGSVLITWFVPSSIISRLQERLGSLKGLHIEDIFYDSSEIQQDSPNPPDCGNPSSPHSTEGKITPSSRDIHIQTSMPGHEGAGAECITEGRDSELIDKSQWTQDMHKWYDSCNKAVMLVVGKTGVGKSTLINALLGEEKALVHKTRRIPTTMDVAPYDMKLGEGVTTVLLDSPGLSDQLTRYADQEYIEKMKAACPVVHVVMVCVRMVEPLKDGDKRTLRVLTAAFGKDIWKHVVIILTNANYIRPLEPSDDTKQFFKSTFNEMRDEVRQFIKRDLQVECSVPVVAAGHPIDYTLPVCDDWRAKVLTKCILQASEEAAVTLLKPHLAGPLGGALALGLTGAAGGALLGVPGALIGGVALNLPGLVEGRYEKSSKVNEAKRGIQTASRHDIAKK